VLKSRILPIIIVLLIILCNGNEGVAQVVDSSGFQTDTLNRKKFALVTVAGASAYTLSIAGLYGLWYKDYPQSSFHFFNDNQEWLQMDKYAHVTASYYIGRIGYSAFRWSGVSEKKAIWYGGMTGFVFLAAIETMDGFSKDWGASTGDLVANTMGTALFISQQLIWHEQKFVMKYSFHSSPYAHYNPDQLGSTTLQHIVKDYNGQTYWISANISSLGLQNTRFPKWLNIAAGYGAEGMTGGPGNPGIINGILVPYSERYRQFYLAADIDLSRIPVKSKTLKLILNTIGFIKIPMPTLEFNKNGVKFHALYF